MRALACVALILAVLCFIGALWQKAAEGARPFLSFLIACALVIITWRALRARHLPPRR